MEVYDNPTRGLYAERYRLKEDGVLSSYPALDLQRFDYTIELQKHLNLLSDDYDARIEINIDPEGSNHEGTYVETILESIHAKIKDPPVR